MTVASIDIGSNTVLLLIAEIDTETKVLKQIINVYRAPRISRGLLPGGKISNEKIDDLLTVLKEYKGLIQQYKCEHTILIATNALRIASNYNDIINRIDGTLNYKTNIISGNEEAYLSYVGATYSFQAIKEKIVLDIGGGSTEIIYGNKSDILYSKSLDLGVVCLTEKFIKHYPPTLTERKIIENTISRKINNIDISIPNDATLIAVAGTPTTLSCIFQNLKKYDEELVDNSILSFDGIYNISNELSTLSSSEILEKYGEVVLGREDLLFAGTLILIQVMKKFSLDIITVSTKGLRHGAVLNFEKYL